MGRRSKQPDEPQPPRDPLRVYNNRLLPIDLCDLWRGCAAFLVLGGPSLNQYPKEVFSDRGILSLGVNNVAAHVQTTAWVCSDPPQKFHHALFFDGKMLTFLPRNKASAERGKLRIKTGEGDAARFDWAGVIARNCPGTFFFDRSECFNPETFLTDETASWGTNRKGNAKTGRERLLFTPFLALRLLHYLGVREVYCVGMDFGMAGDAKYAFGQDRTTDAIRSNNNLYHAANRELKALRPHLDKSGFHVYNVNQESGCHAFDYVPWEKALSRVRGAVPAGKLDLSYFYETKDQVGTVAEIKERLAK